MVATETNMCIIKAILWKKEERTGEEKEKKKKRDFSEHIPSATSIYLLTFRVESHPSKHNNPISFCFNPTEEWRGHGTRASRV